MEDTAIIAELASPRPRISASITAKACPQVADWMPNQPTQAKASSTEMMYRAPCLPRAPSAITATGSPVSQAAMPMRIM